MTGVVLIRKIYKKVSPKANEHPQMKGNNLRQDRIKDSFEVDEGWRGWNVLSSQADVPRVPGPVILLLCSLAGSSRVVMRFLRMQFLCMCTLMIVSKSIWTAFCKPKGCVIMISCHVPQVFPMHLYLCVSWVEFVYFWYWLCVLRQRHEREWIW